MFALALLWLLLLGTNENPAIYDQEIHGDQVGQEGISSLWGGALWIAALVGLSALIGFFLALIIFFVVFLRVRARASWKATILSTLGAAGFLTGLSYVLSLNFPEGILQSMVALPWLLG